MNNNTLRPYSNNKILINRASMHMRSKQVFSNIAEMRKNEMPLLNILHLSKCHRSSRIHPRVNNSSISSGSKPSLFDVNIQNKFEIILNV